MCGESERERRADFSPARCQGRGLAGEGDHDQRPEVVAGIEQDHVANVTHVARLAGRGEREGDKERAVRASRVGEADLIAIAPEGLEPGDGPDDSLHRIGGGGGGRR
jgi:hypothetical protein